jgi:hypothetical protein
MDVAAVGFVMVIGATERFHVASNVTWGIPFYFDWPRETLSGDSNGFTVTLYSYTYTLQWVVHLKFLLMSHVKRVLLTSY